MDLKDYSTEELKAELKRRSDLAKAEKAKVKRCRMCKHFGAVTYTGKPVTPNHILGEKQMLYLLPFQDRKVLQVPQSISACLRTF